MTDAPDFDSTASSEGGDQGQDTSGGNPAWDGIRTQLDPISFSKIEPELKKWDTAAQRNAEIARQYGSYGDVLKDQSPDRVRAALGYSQMLDSNPEQVYELLGNFLRQNGRMPTQQEVAEELEDEGGSEEYDDPRFAQLKEQNDRIAQFLQSQEQAQMQQQADADLGVSLNKLSEAHPELSPEDTQEIIRRVAFAAQQNPSQEIDFDSAFDRAYNEHAQFVNRIRTAPRAGDSAPMLPPTAGGVPTAPGQNRQALGEMKSSDVQDFVSGWLSQNR